MTAATTTSGAARSVALGDWRDRAACRWVDPELFFPTAESGPLLDRQVAAAKAVCAGCPVRARCLAWALDALPYGIAGGLTEQERQQTRAGRRRRPGRLIGQRPVGGSRAEIAAAGRGALRAGWSPRQVAKAFGVTERTAERWATTHTTNGVAGCGAAADGDAVVSETAAGEGSRGGHRAPLRISRAHDALAGTSALEGPRR
jgi:Transcription factor WhiB/Homeodomain-like domain